VTSLGGGGVLDHRLPHAPASIGPVNATPASPETATRIRVAHVVSHPIQYFAPLYRELATRPEIELTVYFYSDASACQFYAPEFARTVRWDTPLLDGYRWKALSSTRGAAMTSRFFAAPRLDVVREVVAERYDVIWAHGYANLTTWLALCAGGIRGAAWLVREEQTLLHGRPWYKRTLKWTALRPLLRRSFGLYIGEQNRRWFLHHDAPEHRLFPARYCVDNDYFRRRADELAPRRTDVRASFGITDDTPVVLFCGKLIAKKRPLLLVEAFEQVRRRHPCRLLMVGDGPLRGAVDDLVRRHRIPDVQMTGFLNQSELPTAYTAADAFTLPSALHETWGLVVNEAMNFSLPVVVSDMVGCGADLVRPDWNGFVFPHDNFGALASALARLVTDPGLRDRFGARSRELVDQYNVPACADGIVEACLAAAGRSEQGHVRAPREHPEIVTRGGA
jgi:glycosyltransferase involved in cell wall biosynthesis